jgi:predicted ATPase
MRTNQNLYVLTGGPGSGKTTTLLALEQLGFSYVPEIARQIIQEQLRDRGDALPWANRERYTHLMLQSSIQSYRQHARIKHITFADRGLPDTLAYARLIRLPGQRTIRDTCERFRYADSVFIAPPWQAIYEVDTERKQDFEEAQRTYRELVSTYKECNYDLIDLPKVSPKERALFILEQISTPADLPGQAL